MSRKKQMGVDGEGVEQAGKGVNVRFITLAGFILLVAGGIVALSVTVPDKPAGTTTRPAAPTTIPPLANTATGIQNPKPFEYDPVTDRHWDPGHGHWHPGQPPANVGSQPGNTTITRGSGAPPVNLPGSATPDIANPKPWQYDPATNKHWHPDHGHWHDGPAPAEGNR